MATLIGTQKFENKNRQWVFVTFDLQGETIEYTVVQPYKNEGTLLVGQDLQDWCDRHEDKMKLEVLKVLYPGAIPKRNSLAGFLEWISDGALDESGQQIQKVDWTNAHPQRLKVLTQVDAAANLDDIKAILRKIIKHID